MASTGSTEIQTIKPRQKIGYFTPLKIIFNLFNNSKKIKNKQIKIEGNKIQGGYVWLPYIPVVVATHINGEVVWYKNKWKNFWLKVKHIFKKPKYLESFKKYSNKMITSHYKTIHIVNEKSDN